MSQLLETIYEHTLLALLYDDMREETSHLDGKKEMNDEHIDVFTIRCDAWNEIKEETYSMPYHDLYQ